MDTSVGQSIPLQPSVLSPRGASGNTARPTGGETARTVAVVQDLVTSDDRARFADLGRAVIEPDGSLRSLDALTSPAFVAQARTAMEGALNRHPATGNFLVKRVLLGQFDRRCRKLADDPLLREEVLRTVTEVQSSVRRREELAHRSLEELHAGEREALGKLSGLKGLPKMLAFMDLQLHGAAIEERMVPWTARSRWTSDLRYAAQAEARDALAEMALKTYKDRAALPLGLARFVIGFTPIVPEKLAHERLFPPRHPGTLRPIAGGPLRTAIEGVEARANEARAAGEAYLKSVWQERPRAERETLRTRHVERATALGAAVLAEVATAKASEVADALAPELPTHVPVVLAAPPSPRRAATFARLPNLR